MEEPTEEFKKQTWEIMMKLLENEVFQENLIEKLNKHVDIPFIGEKREGKIFKALYKILLESLDDFDYLALKKNCRIEIERLIGLCRFIA